MFISPHNSKMFSKSSSISTIGVGEGIDTSGSLLGSYSPESGALVDVAEGQPNYRGRADTLRDGYPTPPYKPQTFGHPRTFEMFLGVVEEEPEEGILKVRLIDTGEVVDVDYAIRSGKTLDTVTDGVSVGDEYTVIKSVDGTYRLAKTFGLI